MPTSTYCLTTLLIGKFCHEPYAISVTRAENDVGYIYSETNVASTCKYIYHGDPQRRTVHGQGGEGPMLRNFRNSIARAQT